MSHKYTECTMAVHGHPRLSVLMPIKCACNFLSVIGNNIGPVLTSFKDTAGLMPHHYWVQNLGTLHSLISGLASAKCNYPCNYKEITNLK